MSMMGSLASQAQSQHPDGVLGHNKQPIATCLSRPNSNSNFEIELELELIQRHTT
jgi:hypothetical protein